MNERYGEQLAADTMDSPAAERNKEPILEVLRRALPETGVVLEVASGTGQHIVHFARGLPRLEWQPTEPDAELRAVLERRVAAAALANVRAPLAFDVQAAAAPLSAAAAVLCINMIHIAPWSATKSLLRHAAQLLGPGAPLILYGPYRRGGEHTAPSNAAFDASLRTRNPEWGLRDLDAVATLAAKNGFTAPDIVAMPANNLTVTYRRMA